MKTLQTAVLWLLLAFTAASVGLGWYVLFTPQPGELEGRILGTCMTVALTSLALLPCLRQLSYPFGVVGGVGSVFNTIAALLVVNIIWDDVAGIAVNGIDYFQILFTAITIGLTCAHISLLILSGLYSLRSAGLSLFLTLSIIGSLALGAQLTTAIWTDNLNERLVTATSLFVAFATVTIPILGHMFGKKATTLEGAGAEAA